MAHTTSKGNLIKEEVYNINKYTKTEFRSQVQELVVIYLVPEDRKDGYQSVLR